MLKILLLQQYYFPEMTGGARRAKELSEQFVKNGHSVTVFTAYPRDFRSMPGFQAKKYEVLNSVLVIRCNTIFSVAKNPIFRMLSYFIYVIHSFIYISQNRKKYNILISMAPLPSAIAAALANKLYKIIHHFDVPDILPDLGISAGMIKNKLFINFLYKLEKWVYNYSNSISAITHGQINNIINKGIRKEKITYIPDWIDDTFFRQNLSKYKDEVSGKLVYPEKKLISFIGNIGVLQNPEIFLNIMMSLSEEKHDEFQFLFIGDGIMLPYLIKKAKKMNLSNVKFIGRVKREHIPAYMNLSHILVANYLPNKYMDICIPGKLYEYLMSKTPIIMGAKGEAANFINKHNAGIVVPPSDVNAFSKAIYDIIDEKFDYNPNYGEFIKDFSLTKIAKSYESVFKSLFKN